MRSSWTLLKTVLLPQHKPRHRVKRGSGNELPATFDFQLEEDEK
jgi:hypothetical protein